MAIQFVMLTILAHALSPHDYGQYLFVLSAVLPTFFLLGFGTSESFVREASAPQSSEGVGRAQMLVGAVGVTSLASGVILGLLAVGLVFLLPAVSSDWAPVLWFILAFFIANGMMFNASQILLSIGAARLAGFFFYPAMNCCLALSTVPYLLLVDQPTFDGVALVTSIAALVAAAVAWTIVLSRVSPRLPDLPTLITLVRSGIRLAAARAMYSAGVWLPTFVAAMMLGTVDAGYLGTMGRLAVAVAAVTAAVRFAVRPNIVKHYAARDHGAIKRMCGQVAFSALLFASLALLASVTFGPSAIRLVFGDDFGPAAPLLSILLVGVLIESFGGPIDEVLKMTGNENQLLAIFAVALPILAVALIVTARISVAAMALIQVAYFLLILIGSLLAVRRSMGLWFTPVWPRSKAQANAAKYGSRR